jgi:hypothetical protein
MTRIVFSRSWPLAMVLGGAMLYAGASGQRGGPPQPPASPRAVAAPGSDGATGSRSEPNPFVVGAAEYQKFLGVMDGCTRVNIARRKL